ncbi:MAG: hypothetical protein ACLT2T_11260 [Bilophila wadsworthia]
MCPFDAIGAGWPCAVNASAYVLRAETALQRAGTVPARARVMVFCSNKDRLKAVTEVCSGA